MANRPLRIALVGYGKMGKAIEQVAVDRGHSISMKLDLDNASDFTAANLAATDVAIEFTSPHSAFENVRRLLEFGIPIVCGSTGWTERLGEITSLCQSKNGSFIYSSNYSIGVNLFFELNKRLASLMAKHPEYEVSLEEIHHTQKKDAPSGTAITLAEGVMENIPAKKKWVNHESKEQDELAIISIREDPAPGTHRILYRSPIDDIEITHTAHNRMGFASGAVLAAEYISSRKGVFQMKEVLGL